LLGVAEERSERVHVMLNGPSGVTILHAFVGNSRIDIGNGHHVEGPILLPVAAQKMPSEVNRSLPYRFLRALHKD